MLKKIFTEIIGTFFIIFIGCGLIILNSIKSNISIIGVGLCYGLTISIMFYIFYNISGAHFNPSISFTNFIMGKLSFIELFFYILSQFIAGFLAIIFIIFLFPLNLNVLNLNIDSTISSNTDLHYIGIIFITEFIFSFLVMFFYTYISYLKSIKIKFIISLYYGIIYFISFVFLYNINNSGINLVRIIIPQLFIEKNNDLIYYIISNLAGSVMGGLTCFKLLIYPKYIKNYITK